MRQYSDLLRYHCITYAKTNKYIMPLLVWLGLLFSHYTVKPLDVVSSFTTSCIYLFFITVWLGLSYFESVDPVSEQILLLKVRKRSTYYCSKYLFLFLMGIVLSLSGALMPVIQNMVNHYGMFGRNLLLEDVASGFFLHVVAVVFGMSVAAIFQPTCIGNRKTALILASFVSLMAVIKDALSQSHGILPYVLWVFPPVVDVFRPFRGAEYFAPFDVGMALLTGMAYSFVLIIIAQIVIRRRLY